MAARDYSDWYNNETVDNRTNSGSLAPFTFICIVVILIMTGLLMLYSSSYAEAAANGQPHYYFVLRQGIFALLGIVCAVAVNFIPVKWIKLSAVPLVALAFITMLLTLLTPFGVTVMGARRWLDLPVIPQFQPSEVAKLAIIIFLAWWFTSQKTRQYIGWYYVVPLLLILALTLLIFIQRAYTTGIHFLILALALCIAGRLKLRYVFTACAFLAVPAVFYMLSEGYRVRRIASFLIPSLDPQGLNWQVNMSLSAIAEGGFFGKGIGNGVYKMGLLPEVQNDFILASIIEETKSISVFSSAEMNCWVACAHISILRRSSASKPLTKALVNIHEQTTMTVATATNTYLNISEVGENLFIAYFFNINV